MPKYVQKRNAEVEGILFTGDNLRDVVKFVGEDIPVLFDGKSLRVHDKAPQGNVDFFRSAVAPCYVYKLPGPDGFDAVMVQEQDTFEDVYEQKSRPKKAAAKK